MDGDWARLAAAVRAARKRMGLNQMELGDLTGVKRTVIQTIERGHGFQRITGTLLSVERALGWGPGSVERVLNGGDPQRSEDAAAPPATGHRQGRGAELSVRVASLLSEGTVLDTAIVPLTPNADVIVVVQAKPGASREGMLAALRVWERREGYLRGRLGRSPGEPSGTPQA
jgi:hypothetical protein